MKILGITGGIGTGKSTVSNILFELGAKVVEADKIAREVTKKGQKALNEIEDFFGKEVLDKFGELDRKKLAEIVFKNTEKLKNLNNIVHKYTSAKILDIISNENKNSKTKVLVLDVPIPNKNSFIDVSDEIWVVVAEFEIRLKRIALRSNLSKHEILDRINSQLTQEDYISIANIIIYNNEDLDSLQINVKTFFNKFIKKANNYIRKE